MRTAINAMVSEIRLTLHIVDATRMVVPRKHSRSPAVLAILVSVTLNHAPFDTTTQALFSTLVPATRLATSHSHSDRQSVCVCAAVPQPQN